MEMTCENARKGKSHDNWFWHPGAGEYGLQAATLAGCISRLRPGLRQVYALMAAPRALSSAADGQQATYDVTSRRI